MAIDFQIRQSLILPEVYTIEPNKFSDLRGDIWSAFIEESLGGLVKGARFCHDKFINSHFNVLRGIHGDSNTWKFVTCVYGEVMQVVVDCREDSQNFGKYESFIINTKNQKIILIPPNFGNAHYVRSKEAVYYYKLAYNGEYTDCDKQFTYPWNDKRFNINWGDVSPILSNRDIEARGR